MLYRHKVKAELIWFRVCTTDESGKAFMIADDSDGEAILISRETFRKDYELVTKLEVLATENDPQLSLATTEVLNRFRFAAHWLMDRLLIGAEQFERLRWAFETDLGRPTEAEAFKEQERLFQDYLRWLKEKGES